MVFDLDGEWPEPSTAIYTLRNIEENPLTKARIVEALGLPTIQPRCLITRDIRHQRSGSRSRVSTTLRQHSLRIPSIGIVEAMTMGNSELLQLVPVLLMELALV
jgi:hypothetical protein